MLIAADGNPTTATFRCQCCFCLTPLGGAGVDVEIDALKPAVDYSVQWEAEWTQVQIRFSHS